MSLNIATEMLAENRVEAKSGCDALQCVVYF